MKEVQGRPSPNRIMGVAVQYWQSALLLNALKLDLFSRIPGEGATVEFLVSESGFSKRHLELFLDALTAHEFLDKRDGRYFNAADVAVFLKKESPAFMGRALAYAMDLYEPWGNLHKAVREGRPVVPEQRHLGAGGEETRHFVRAMHERALAMGPALTAEFDLAGASTLLDLGGGPGTLSAQLTRKYPGLHATVLDLPAVAEHAGEILRERGDDAAVKAIGGSYHEALPPQVGGPFDAVLLSGQMHQESLEGSDKVIANAVSILKPGGRLFLIDIMVEDAKTGPRFATLFGINMCLTRNDGGVHSRAEMEAALGRAGLKVRKQGAVALDYPYYYFLAEK
jgi:SAM-dependent methyltransferase